MDNEIILAPSSEWGIKKVVEKIGKKKIRWIYVGEQIKDVYNIEKELGTDSKIELSGRIDEWAERSCREYVEYIGNLSLKYKSPLWWSLRFSAKGPEWTTVFMNTGYLKICLEILREFENENLVIFVENRRVREAIIKNLEGKKITRFEQFLEPISEKGKLIAKFFFHRTKFIFYMIYKILILRLLLAGYYSKKFNSSKTGIVIQTHVEPTHFGNNSIFNIPRYSGLVKRMKDKGIDVSYFSKTPHSIMQVSKLIKESKENFIVPEYFLSFVDVFRVVFNSLKIFKYSRYKYPNFQDMEIMDFIAQEMVEEAVEPFNLNILLNRYTVEKIRKKNIMIDRFFLSWENGAEQRSIIYPIRKFYPNCYIIGHQHSLLSDLYIKHFVGRKEMKIAPIPNRIITDSRITTKILINWGYPKEKVCMGPAYRYEYLLKKEKITKKFDPKYKKRKILLLLNVNNKASAELLYKMIIAFQSNKQCIVGVKPHALTLKDKMITMEKIRRLLPVHIPSNFILVNETLTDIIENWDVMVYHATTAAFEGMFLGIPVVHVKSDLIIDMEPLKGFLNERKSVRTPEEIYSAIVENYDDLIERADKLKKRSNEIFNIVEDKNFELILKD